MKLRSGFFRWAAAFLCAFGLAFGLGLCFVTAYRMDAQLPLMAEFCGVAAAAGALCQLPKNRLPWTFLVCGGAVLFAVFHWPDILASGCYAVNCILLPMGSAYPAFSDVLLRYTLPEGTDAVYFLGTLGIALALLTTHAVGQRRSGWLASGVSTALFALCLLITDRYPSPAALGLFVGSLLLLLLPQSRRQLRPEAGDRLTLALAVPILLLLAGLSAFAGPGEAPRPAWADRLAARFAAMTPEDSLFRTGSGTVEYTAPPALGTLGRFVWNSDPNRVDLTALGPQQNTGVPAMNLFSDTDQGSILLRGFTLGVYDGKSWTALPETAYPAAPDPALCFLGPEPAAATVRVRTGQVCDILYLPYLPTDFPEGAAPVYDQRVANGGRLREYKVPVTDPAPVADPLYEAFVFSAYTQLPEGLAARLSDLTAAFLFREELDSAQALAQAVSDFVSQSAEYSLNTPKPPPGQDFVEWFLRESDTGYCVHFASAATVLLRCLGIPARYVSGYLADAKAREWTTVSQDDAHAWVEYYAPGVGWLPLDPTPGGADSTQENSAQPESQPEPAPEPEPLQPPEDPSTPEPEPGLPTILPEEPEPAVPARRAALWLLAVPILWAALWGPACRALRNRRLRRGDRNQQALEAYHFIQRLSRLVGSSVPIRMDQLAQKARFSRNGVEQAELEALQACAQDLHSRLKQDSGPVRRAWLWLFYGL